MADSSTSSAPTRVVLLGDEDTAAHRDDLAEDALRQGYVIAGAYGFPTGAAPSADDLTEVDAVVAALGRAIAGRLDVWVPFPGPDFVREQHLRRISLVLQRHGLNLWLLQKKPIPAPIDGGVNEIDYALRCEVKAVDALDCAALAAEGAKSLGREIELALAAGGPAPDGRRLRRPSIDAKGARRADSYSPPTLPPPSASWGLRQPVLKRYVRWLVHGCGVTQAATARVLNSTGQRTPR